MAEMTTGADPADHTVPEVLDHLQSADQDEQQRVFEAELAGNARVGILDHAPFDPGQHTVPEVNDYLAKADDDERKRVLDAERAGQGRVTILDKHDDEPGEQVEPVAHSEFVDAAHEAAQYALRLANQLDDALAEVIATHAAVIAENVPDAGEESVWGAHNRIGFALTDLERPIAALRSTATELLGETSSRGAVDVDLGDDDDVEPNEEKDA